MHRLRPYLTLPNLFRVLLAVVMLTSIQYVQNEKSPWKTAWGKRMAQKESPSYKEHVNASFWFAAGARAGLAGAILLLSWKWGARKRRRHSITLAEGERAPNVSNKKFYLTLALIGLVALGMRLPRMSHSFWGDEAAAMATYVHGMWRPVVKTDLQGPLFFEQPTWHQTFFSAKQGGNNHVLFSLSSRACLTVWRAVTGKDDTQFVEWVTRIPSLLAGIGSLVALAMLMRQWGASSTGLLAAAFMAMHPWHVRYSTEARGYSLALLMIPLFLMAVTRALEGGRWRAWLSVAALEFLLMYSWAGMLYPLAAANAGILFWLLRGEEKLVQVSRWLTAGLLAAMAFVSLYAPHLPQIAEAREKLLWIKGLPMDAEWFHNILVGPFTGIVFHRQMDSNAAEMSWQGLFNQSPWITGIGFAFIIIAFLVGMVVVWRRNAVIASLLTSAFVGAVLCTLHFKFVLEDEMRTWYLLFTLPALSILVAMGLVFLSRIPFGKTSVVKPGRSVLACVVLFFLISASLWPMNASLVQHPEENFKEARAITLDREETFDPNGRSKVYVSWLWRYSQLYDPRGTTYTRSGPTLLKRMKEASDAGGKLYVIVGYKALALTQNAELLAILNDPNRFEMTGYFPSRESLHSLEVYRMK